MILGKGLESIVRRGLVSASLIGLAAISACGYLPNEPGRAPSPRPGLAENGTATSFKQPETQTQYTPTTEGSFASPPTIIDTASYLATSSGTPIITLTPANTPTETPTPSPSPTTFVPSATLEPTATAYLTPTQACEGEKKIVVNSSPDVQMIYAIIEYPCSGDIEKIHESLVSTGTVYHPTVLGEFEIYTKYKYTDMAGPGYYLEDVPYTMYFYEGYGIHGAFWHHNFGTRMSHGCVNLPIDPSDSINLIREDEWFYNWGYVGMKVISCSDDPNYGIYTDDGVGETNDYYGYCQILR